MESSAKTEEERLEKYLKAAAIARAVEQEIISTITKPAEKILTIAERIEEEIRKRGGSPAFPVNICINDIAAHYTPLPEEAKQISTEDMIKIDFGVHIDGYPVDRAITFYFGEDEDKKEMIKVAEEALRRAIEAMKPRTRLSYIGEIIEDYVKERGFKVIRNLNGHLLDQYLLHGEKEVPTSASVKSAGIIEEGEVYAVEIFVTNGEGYARASDDIRIYSILPELPKRLPIRVRIARYILRHVYRERKGLPFTMRWLLNKFREEDIRIGLATLDMVGVLISYPVLVEKEGSYIAQAEDTVIIRKDGAQRLIGHGKET